MQSQNNKEATSKINDSLESLRTKIDKIDDNILSLLKERMAIVLEVGKLKESNNDKFFIKSAREADMIKNLIDKSKDFIKPQVIINIWRSLITSANISEQNIEVFLLNDEKNTNSGDLVRNLEEYYGNLVKICETSDFNDIFSEKNAKNAKIIASGEKNIHILHENLLKNDKKLMIFAKIPSISGKNSKNPVFLFANKQIEKSQSDNSVVLIDSDLSVDNLMEYLGDNLEVQTLQRIGDGNKFLVEISGFSGSINEELLALEKNPHIRKVHFLGIYPTLIGS